MTPHSPARWAGIGPCHNIAGVTGGVEWKRVFEGQGAHAIALALPLGLALAVFGHFHVWVHYFATEEPDMREIYGT